MKNEVIVLGFSLGFDTGAALVSSKTGILYAINEERIVRQKNTKEFPVYAIEACMKKTNVHFDAITAISYTNYETDDFFNIAKRSLACMQTLAVVDYAKHNYEHEYIKYRDNEAHLSAHRQSTEYIKLTRDFIKDCLKIVFGDVVDSIPIYRVDHHAAHGAAAMMFSGVENDMLAITSDGFGDDVSMRILHIFKDAEGLWNTDRLQSSVLEESIGLVYQFVTGAAGYKMHEHEGKITGLAARGDDTHTYPMLKEAFENIPWEQVHIDGVKNYYSGAPMGVVAYDALQNAIFKICSQYIQKSIMSHPDDESRTAAKQTAIENLAAGVQTLAEIETLDRLKTIELPKDKTIDVVLAGGVFANVELNRKIAALSWVNSIFVFPHMGDGGGAVGSCCSLLFTLFRITIHNKLDHVFFGYDISEDEIKHELSKLNQETISVTPVRRRGEAIAELVAKGFIVANVVGKMEYGPRALCHRSIHFNCTDKNASTWLNKQLSRTETMPFAPVITEENAKKYFKDYSVKTAYAGRFMTINYLATDEFKELCPGAVHLDGTVRAQVVNNIPENADIITALHAYEQLTGKPAFINTSYNRHGEPIVMTASEAICRFLESNIHYLVLGDYIIKHPNSDTYTLGGQ